MNATMMNSIGIILVGIGLILNGMLDSRRTNEIVEVFAVQGETLDLLVATATANKK